MNKVTDLTKVKIINFFKNDVLDFSQFPDSGIKGFLKKHGTIDTRIIKNEENRKSYKDLLLAVVLIGKPYSYKNASDSISCIFNLSDFFSSLGNISFFNIDTDDLKIIFKDYCKEKKLSNSLVRIIVPCQYAILEYRDDREGFDRDFWDKSIIKIASK